MKWPKVLAAAQRVALQAVGDEEAHFELKLDRSAVTN